MKASDLFVRCLENERVEYIFGVPGEENADFMMSILDSPVEFVICRHEQAAAFMADAYGRLTGKAACCLGTLGPGATNLITGVGDANMDRAPMVVLTGQASTTRIHKESHQAMDLVALFKPCVKWGILVTHPDAIPEIVRKAFRIAETDKYGATHIDLPENVAKMQTLATPIPVITPPRPAPMREDAVRAANKIKEAKFPIILSGNGTLRNRATDQLRKFAAQTGIPVTNTFMGKGCMDPGNPQYLYTIGLGSRDIPAAAFERADCVISVGFDMIEYHPKSWNRGNDKVLIHIDTQPSEIDDNYRTDVELIGDIGASLTLLTEQTTGSSKLDPSVYSEFHDAMHKDLHVYDDDDGFPVKPQKILADVRAVMDDRDIILSDVGAHKMWIARYLHSSEPNTILISNGWCTMGFALPGSIGAQLACKDRRVIAIGGDGGTMMNIQDLETMVRLELPILVMVWTDSQYGLIRWKQESQFGKYSHIDFTNPDFMKLAEAFGMNGYKVEKAADLLPMLKEARESNRPCFIEVPVDYSMNQKLTSSLKEIPFENLCDCLANVPIFAKIPEQYRRAIADEMEEVEIPAGSDVMVQGEPGDAMYIVHSGKGAILKDEKEVHTVGEGDYFGELAVLADTPRTATVRATEDMVVSRLSGELFRNMVRAEPDMGLMIASVMAERAAKA